MTNFSSKKWDTNKSLTLCLITLIFGTTYYLQSVQGIWLKAIGLAMLLRPEDFSGNNEQNGTSQNSEAKIIGMLKII